MVSGQPGWREEFVSSLDDSDFGHLELWRTLPLSRTPPIVAHDWLGAVVLPDGTKVRLTISGMADELEQVGARQRAAFRMLVEREPEMRRRVAERILPIAIEWAGNAEDQHLPEPSVDQLTQWLRLEAITMSDAEPSGRISFWYEERQHDTFLGHSVLARFAADCTLLDADLAG